MAVLTLNDLTTKFGFTIPESRRAYFQELLDAGIAACYRFLGLTADGTAARTDYFDGDAGSKLFLRVTPVASVSSVSFRGKDSYKLIDASQYRVDPESGILTLYAAPAMMPDAVKVNYLAGWADNAVPEDIRYCIAETVRYMSKISTSSQVGVTSRTTEGGTEQLEQGMPPAFVKQHLRRWCLQSLR